MQEVTVEKGKMREVFSKKLRGVEPLDVVLLAQESGTCLGTADGRACGGALVLSADDAQEYVCSRCGRVWGQKFEDEQIPFSESDVAGGHAESSYNPTGHMDYGLGLGSKNDRGVDADVLGGRTDPLSWSRSNHVRIPLANPLILKLLGFGSQFCNKYDLHQRHNMNHARFADQLGINLRLVGEHYVRGVSRLWADPWRCSAALFCLLFRESYPERYNSLRFKNDGETEKRFPELCLPEEVLTYFGLVLKSCSPPVLPQLP